MQTDVTGSNSRLIETSNFAADAARLILDEARAAIDARGLFRFALAGGNTPRIIYAELARSAGDLPWNRVQITFGDERCVPPDSDRSNFRMAREALLDHVAIPEGNIFRMRGEIEPAAAAREYEEKLAAVAARFGEPRYVHDLILLGLGEDGHTASLFPGTAALAERERNVVANHVPQLATDRITFTYPLINCARSIYFLVNDRAKRPLVEEILAGGSSHPAAGVQGAVRWIVAKA